MWVRTPQFFGNGAFGELQTHFHPSVVAMLLFYHDGAVGFQGYYTAGKQGWERGWLQLHKAHCSYWNWGSFLSINTPQIVTSLWLISWVPHKLILIIFLSVFLLVFWRSRNLEGLDLLFLLMSSECFWASHAVQQVSKAHFLKLNGILLYGYTLRLSLCQLIDI